MNRTLKIRGKDILYRVQSYRQSKHIRVSIKSDGTVHISSPKYVPILIIQAFLKTKADWILEKLAQVKPLSQSAHNKKVIFLEHKEKALKIIQDKVEVLNKVYGFAYGNITIRDQRSRWGSCSKRGDLSFNYRLVLLPERLLGYVVVHELCHLKEFNHSRAFWDLVALGDPDYLLHKKELKKEGLRMQ